MADTKINRSFIPPTETEKVDSEVYPIVWALGTTEHPWKNLFLSDYETKEGETLKVIDVYSTLKDVGDIPKTGKEYGNVLTVDQNKSSLKWRTLNDVIDTHATANALVSKISSTPVQRAEADEDGLNIKSNYFKQTSFTANNIKSTLGNVAVKRAEADSSGNKFQDTYVNREYVDNNYIHRTGSSTSSALTDQGLGAVCFTNSYNDLDDKPYIPDSEWVKTEIDARINTHVQQKHVPLETRLTADETQITTNKNNIATNAANITTNATNIATNTSNITAANNRITALSNDTIHLADYATTSKAGIVKISTANGLNIGSSGLLTVDKATSSKVGVVKVNGGNGLGYNASNGSVYMDKATTGQLGTVKIGSNINVSDGTISLNTASTSNLGLVKVGSNINVSSGTISVNTGSTTALGVLKTGSNITNSSGTISLTKANVVAALGYTPPEAGHYPGEIFAVIGVGTGYAITGCVPCDGSTYTAAMYKDFWDNYINNGKLTTCTLTAYNNEIKTLNGQCAKWGKGKDSNNQDVFRVPTLPSGTFIQQGTSGERFAPGLPNITGQFHSVEESGFWYTGCFYQAPTHTSSEAAGPGGPAYTLGFDASKGGSTIYGNSTTVQPQSVCVQYYVCLAGGAKNDTSVDWSKWETAMSLKMDKNSWCVIPSSGSSTATSEKPAVIVTNVKNGSSWYRIWSDGWIEQGGLVSSNLNSIHSFNKSFKDTNYSLAFSMNGSSTGPDSYCFYCWPYDASNFKIYTTGFGCNKVWWYACGY